MNWPYWDACILSMWIIGWNDSLIGYCPLQYNAFCLFPCHAVRILNNTFLCVYLSDKLYI